MVVDLINAIRDFAVGLGWTNSKQGTNARGGYLFLEKGIAHISMEWVTTIQVNTFPGLPTSLTGVLIFDHRIIACANSSIDLTKTTWWNHGGYPTTIEQVAYASTTTGLTGPLSAWHLFSNATGDYIHVAVQTSGDLYQHFSFGLIDKGAMTHSGAAYTTGTTNWFYFNSPAATPGASGFSANHPSDQAYPFSGHSTLYVPDALPAAYGKFVSSPSSAVRGVLLEALDCVDKPSDLNLNSAGTLGRLLDHIPGATINGWSGTLPLFGVPVISGNAQSPTRWCAMGMFADVRFLNMEGLIPGQELLLGTDTWKIFPVLRQEPWSSSGNLYKVSSGQYAIAYKKAA